MSETFTPWFDTYTKRQLAKRIVELEAERETWNGQKVVDLLRKDMSELIAERDLFKRMHLDAENRYCRARNERDELQARIDAIEAGWGGIRVPDGPGRDKNDE